MIAICTPNPDTPAETFVRQHIRLIAPGNTAVVYFEGDGRAVTGIPSMRILKYIGVFTPEPWQGYGFDDESKEILAQGRINGKDITYG